jgi:hypothetical protein
MSMRTYANGAIAPVNRYLGLRSSVFGHVSIRYGKVREAADLEVEPPVN